MTKSVRVDPADMEWIERKIREKRFFNFTHAWEAAIAALRDLEEGRLARVEDKPRRR